MNREVRRITEGAMMVALLGVLLLINRQFFGIMESFLWILPLPLVLYSAKYGLKNSLVPLVAVFFLTFLFGTISSIFLFNSMAWCGAVYGSSVKKKVSTKGLLWIAIGFGVFANLVTMVLFASVFGYNIGEELIYLEKTFTEFGVLLEFPGQSIQNVLFLTYILSTILMGVMEGLIVHYLSCIVLKRLNIAMIQPTKNTNGLPSKWSGYVACAFWALGVWVAPYSQGNEFVFGIAQIAIILSMGFLFYWGCIIFLRELMKKINKLYALGLLVIVLLLIQYTGLFLVFLGVFGITMNRQ